MTNTSTAPTGTIEHIDPQTVIIEANVRPGDTMAPLTKEFISSVREHGVLIPVLGYRDDQGNVIVRAGQRRTLAAREVGAATIPVYIVDGATDTATRVIEQLVENEHRQDLSDGERAAAWQQLAFEGLSVATIAKRTGTKRSTVVTGLAVAENAVAASAVQEHALTLDQAAVLMEFEDDENTRAELIEFAQQDPAQFPHAAQRARDERARAKVQAEVEADLTARGFEVLPRERGYYETDYTRITELLTPDGERATEESIADVDGRAASVHVWSADSIRVTFYLSDPKAVGFRKDSGAGASSGPMTDEQKAERRTLIANNKAWASAEVVRREWLTTLLSRKTLPKDAARVIAQALTIHRMTVSGGMSNGNALAHELLGIERASIWDGDKLAAIIDQTPTKALHVSLAVVLGGIEAHAGKQTWRNPSKADAAYFTQLAAWGYALSDVERIVTGDTATTTDDTEE